MRTRFKIGWPKCILVALVLCNTCIALVLYIGLGHMAYKGFVETGNPEEAAQARTSLFRIYLMPTLFGLSLVGIYWLGRGISKFISIQLRLVVFRLVKGLSYLVFFVVVPWEGTHAEKRVFLGYSVIWAPLDRNQFETQIDFTTWIFSLGALYIAHYAFLIGLLGCDEAYSFFERKGERLPELK